MATKMINSLKFGSDTHPFTLPYGTATVSGTAISVDVDNFSLETGARVLVKFPTPAEMKDATLNVNNTGEKVIRNPSDMTQGQRFHLNKIYEFVYDGTNYEPIIAPIGWAELEHQGNRPNTQVGRLNAGGDYKGWIRMIEWDTSISTFHGQLCTLIMSIRSDHVTSQTCMFDISLPNGTGDAPTFSIIQTQGRSTVDYTGGYTGWMVRKLRLVKGANNKYYLEYYVPPEEKTTTSSGMTVLARVDGTHGEAFYGKLIVGGEVETETSLTVLKEITVLRDIHPAARTVLYDVVPSSTVGLRCNGKTTADSTNSVTLSDPNKIYKRLEIYARFPYANIITSYDLNIPNQGNDTTFGNRNGGLMGFGADHTNGASKHVLYQLNFSIKEVTDGWTIQVTDSGWINLGIPAASSSQYTSTDISVNGTAYATWNQRHNYSYAIYRIVGYTD